MCIINMQIRLENHLNRGDFSSFSMCIMNMQIRFNQQVVAFLNVLRYRVTAWSVVPVLQVTIVPVPRRPDTAQPGDKHHQMHKM